MEWIKKITKRIHPQNLLDLFVDAVLLMMEIWAVLRVALILLIVIASMMMYAVERVSGEYDENKLYEGDTSLSTGP